MHSNRSFNQWIRQRRRFLNLTQAELADLVGCSVSTEQKFEDGSRRPSKQIAELLAIHLQIPEAEKAAFLRAAREIEGTEIAVVKGEEDNTVPQQSDSPSQPRNNNLPAPLTQLIGRVEDRQTILDLLVRADVRLVTITGTAGVGKTRLSIAVAQQLLATGMPNFADGIWFVQLAVISEPRLVLSSIAHTLEIRQSGSLTILEEMVRRLYDKQMLLVLDNFEQIVEAAPDLSDLLARCPYVKLLVTSRSPLLLRGEYQYALSPFEILSLARLEGQRADRLEYEDSSAVKLFVTTVQRFDSHFTFSSANAAVILKICSRLGGVALAIELAASRLRQFNIDALLSHLQQPSVGALALLTGGARDLPNRQRTLHAAIRWSYDLLDRETQRIFAICGLFVGGFGYDALSQIVLDGRTSGGHQTLLLSLQTLLDHSLLVKQEQDKQARYGMLDTIAEFALEQLRASGEEESIRQRHAESFLLLAESGWKQMQQSAQMIWADRLERELDNLRLAFTWFCSNAPAKAVALAGALKEFWYFRGYYHEGRRWLSLAMEKDNSQTSEYARALLSAGQLAHHQGENQYALRLLESSVALYRQVGTAWEVAESLREYGWSQYQVQNRQGATASFEESLQLFRSLGDQAKIAGLLLALLLTQGIQKLGYESAKQLVQESIVLLQKVDEPDTLLFAYQAQSDIEMEYGNHELAAQSSTKNLALARKLGVKRQIAYALLELSLSTLWLGDAQTGLNYVQEAMTYSLELGDTEWTMIAWYRTGDCQRRLGDLAEAQTSYRRCLEFYPKLNNQQFTTYCFLGLSAIALQQGRSQQAAYLLASAQKIIDALPPFLIPATKAEMAQLISTAHAHLEETTFASKWAEGYAAPIEQVLEEINGRV